MTGATRLRWALLAVLIGTAAARAETGRQERQQRQRATRVVRRIYDQSQPVPGAGALMNPNGQKEHLTHDIYVQMRNISVELLRRYPADQHFFLGIGRSPAPVIAFMQNLERKGQRAAGNFPTSGLHGDSELDASLEGAYDEHFAHFIPKDVIDAGRTIVLIDRSVSNSGSSIWKVKLALQRYLTKVGSKSKVVGVSYSDGAPNPKYELDYVSTNPFTELLATNTSYYEDQIGEYPSHYIQADTKPTALQRRDAFDEYKRLMRTRQVVDAELDRHLSEWKLRADDDDPDDD